MGSWAPWLVTATAVLLLLTGLGILDLWAPDEPRYARVAEELRRMDQGPRGLILLHLNGEAYTQKPPLYFWLAAVAGAAQGHVSEWAARLPSALAGVACVALSVRFGASLLGPAVGALGGAVLLTSFEFAHRARRAQLDVLLTLLELMALAAFWRLDRGSAPRRRDLLLFHGALGLAVLTKGPVGLIVPLLVIGSYLYWEGRLASLRRLLPPWALLLSLGPGLAWVAGAAAVAPAGWADEAIVENLIGRFFAGSSHARPVYYYFYQLPIAFLPWTLLLPLVALEAPRALRERDGAAWRAGAWRFLLAWLGASFVFFSLSAGKRGLYLLPAFPALALLCADAARRALARRGAWPRVATRGLAGLTLVAVAAALAAPRIGAGFGVTLPWSLGAVFVGIALAAWGAWARWPGRAPESRLWIPIGALVAAELALFTLLLPGLDPEKSPRPIAAAAAALTAADEPLGLVGKPTLLGGLAYYAERRVTLLDDPGRLERFLAEGGRTLVIAGHQLERVRSSVPLTIHARARRGRRTLLVATPSPGAEP